MASRVTPPRPSHARPRNGHLFGVLWTKRSRLLSTCNELEESHRVLMAPPGVIHLNITVPGLLLRK